MNEYLITYVKSFDNLPSDILLKSKRELCLTLDCQPANTINNLSKWNNFTNKPQYIHSAAKLYLSIKYEHLRSKESFVNLIFESNLQIECLNIAIDVLRADEDCHKFLAEK